MSYSGLLVAANNFVNEGRLKIFTGVEAILPRAGARGSDVVMGILFSAKFLGVLDKFVVDKQESSLELTEPIPVKVRDLFSRI